MQCPKCKSENVTSQIITGTIQEAKQKHGIIWWILIGWWRTILKFLVFGIWMFVWRIYKSITKKAEAQEFIKTAHVCNDCGYGWTTEIN